MAKLVSLHGWRSLLALVFLITSSKVAYATSQALIVPIYDSERPPLFFNLNERQNGVYVELFETILRSANIQYELVPVPKLRARIMFETGETVLSCCDNEAWRQRPKEKDVQLFSNAFFHSADYVIVHKDTEFDFSKSLSLSIGTIRGFG